MSSNKPVTRNNNPANGSAVINSLLVLLLVIAVPLLFTTEVKLYQHRLMPFIWNLGHIMLFFSVVWLGLNLARQPSKPGFWALLLGINILVFGISVGIEEIQSAQGRLNSLEDIYKNCLGATLALLLHAKTRVVGDKILSTLRWLVFLLIAFALVPLAINTVDSIYARVSFPVLADFETPFETERWSGKNLVVIETGSGNHLLQNDFQPGRYSTLSFIYFAPDWSAYDCLGIRIKNSGADSIALNLRINDKRHNANDRRYVDRFNYKTLVQPGWNQLRIPLVDIRQAPRSREMNMTQLEEITFFSANLRQPVALLFDDIELENAGADCVPGQGPES